jgi:glycerol-3-phosphate dehydrogenase
MDRIKQIEQVESTKMWDLIIIGGGASGLGIAVDAASRGYKTLLLEAVDFAKGTSSRSTKLAHGGVRYLAQGNIRLVFEALKERGLMLKNAAHLTKNQSFVIPIYNRWTGYYYKIGLTMYDWLSANLSFGNSSLISKENTIKLLPNINSKGLKSGVVYHDGQFDDARLAINLAQTAIENGATVLNYAKVVSLTKDNLGNISGLIFENAETSERHHVKSKLVINATGIFTNEIMKMNNTVVKKYVVPSQGVHIVLENHFLNGNHAVMIPKTKDGRVLFIVPWHHRLIVGTTDTLIDTHLIEPIALNQEIDFILNTAQEYLNKKPTRADIVSVFAGLRPLSAPDDENEKTKEISRSHKILVSETGLITITGGKWTTYRKMAEDVVNKAIKLKVLPKAECVTAHLKIHGSQSTTIEEQQDHLYIYGSDLSKIIDLQNQNQYYKTQIHPKYPHTIAEVVWAIRFEMARSIDDVLARRVRLLFIDAQAAIESVDIVAQILSDELGKDTTWKENQIVMFNKIAEGFLISSRYYSNS